MSRVTGLTPKKTWQELFIEELAATGNVSLAAKKAKVSRVTAYKHRGENPAFRQQWEEALEQAADVLEAEAWRRAAKGVRKPVYQGGKKVGEVQEYSDVLLIFLLKGVKPEKFRERFQVDGTQKHSGSVDVNHNGAVDVNTLPPDEQQRRYREALAGVPGSPPAASGESEPGPVSPEPGTGGVPE